MNTSTPEPETLKETLISIVIAFALAFVFRGFVAEAFVIPTGSMAPTLLGQHMRFHGPASGYDWAVGPWDANTSASGDYAGIQGTRTRPITVNDPMSGEFIERPTVRLRAGDRILVLKYLYGIMSPSRYDVIVFNNPTEPSSRYIKRLIGLPGEQIALVDGDVFSRPAPAGWTRPDKNDPEALAHSWGENDANSGWKIARKPDHVQRALWQPIFDSEYTPVGPTGSAGSPPDWFRRPWTSPSKGWSFDGPTYSWKPTGAETSAVLTFDQSLPRFNDDRLRNTAFGSLRTRETWGINDRYPYDETPHPRDGVFNIIYFPVSDLRLRAGLAIPATVSDAAPPLTTATAVIEARGHIFTAEFSSASGGTVTLRIQRPHGESGIRSAPETIASASVPGLLQPGGGNDAVHNVEFWHSDQRLTVWVDGKQVLEHDASLDWTPAQRVHFATGQSLLERLDTGRIVAGVLSSWTIYQPPKVYWEIAGGEIAMHRVGLDRDLYYQPTNGNPNEMLTAVDPNTTVNLSPDQFFVCGDNSPASLDARAWGVHDPWVRSLIDPTQRVVPRDLLIGKAFFVYFPALLDEGGPGPMIDFGRMRFIW